MISQKATILCIYEILKKYSDENHLLSTDKIREKLKKVYDVDMERRAVYRNIDALRSMGIEIEGYSENREGYYLIDRAFEPSEIRLLCDAVASSEMINDKTSKRIIQRLTETQSIFQSRMLQKTIYVKENQPSENNQIFFNIDTLNIAINQGCKVSAFLLGYDLNMHLSKISPDPIVFSPYATLWASGNYYILAKTESEESLTHLRIDRLKNIELLEQGIDMVFGGINPMQYAQKHIFNHGEESGHFTLDCDPSLWEHLTEDFGTGLSVIGQTESSIRIRIISNPSVIKSWVLSHADLCEVVSPKNFREEIQKTILTAYKKYW